MFKMFTMLSRRRSRPIVHRDRRSANRLRVEQLESRQLLAALPFGAQQDDTGEFMLGDVYVTVVGFESNGTRDANTENWNEAYRNRVKANVESGLQWWVDTLAEVTDKHQLRFQVDYTYLDTPVATGFEPISRSSADFQFWIYDFLNLVGHNQSGNFSSDIRAFNHAQRLANQTHWAFTIFVVNDQNDPDGRFAPGSFDRAFAYAGGRFFVTPAGRPDSTFAHETGHMFWARDEYSGGGTYNAYRGYYNTQNYNAWDNPVFTSQAQREPSIMDRGACEEGGGLLCIAFQNNTSSRSSLEMIGWRDSDQDGIFDLLDVPHTLTGMGGYDPASQTYQFRGESRVQTLPNRNTSGFQNDITIATISRVEYRINEGPWQTGATYDTYTAQIDLTIPLIPGNVIDFRTIDVVTGVTSPVFRGDTLQPTLSLVPGIQGLVWRDEDQDGTLDATESRLSGWTVQVVDTNGSPLQLASQLEPDVYPSTTTLLNQVLPRVTVSSVGTSMTDNSVFSITVPGLAGNERVFGSFSAACGGFCSDWTASSRNLRIDFAEPVMRVELDAIGRSDRSRGRLEAYDVQGNLLARYTTQVLATNRVEPMVIERELSDVSYVIARAQGDATVYLDRLHIGPTTSTTTREDGSYLLGYLPPGEYRVAVTAPSGFAPTNPSPARRSVTLSAGQILDGADFGFSEARPTHQNPQNRFDVNGDGTVAPQDVLLIINFLNSRGASTVDGITAPPYRDVNGDNAITSIDALQIINFINSSLIGESEGSSELNLLELLAIDKLQATGSTQRDVTVASPPNRSVETRSSAPLVARAEMRSQQISTFPLHGTLHRRPSLATPDASTENGSRRLLASLQRAALPSWNENVASSKSTSPPQRAATERKAAPFAEAVMERLDPEWLDLLAFEQTNWRPPATARERAPA
jgi:hypothetical protein